VTVEEFNSIYVGKEFSIVHVAKHKTYHSSGPATLTFNRQQYQWMRLFLGHIRCFAGPKVNNFFVSASGQAMTPGAISNQINSLWVKAAGILSGREYVAI
jgi:hypothetical protein